jgi:hypothetical protein
VDDAVVPGFINSQTPITDCLIVTFGSHVSWLQNAISRSEVYTKPLDEDISPRKALRRTDFPDPTGPITITNVDNLMLSWML